MGLYAKITLKIGHYRIIQCAWNRTIHMFRYRGNTLKVNYKLRRLNRNWHLCSTPISKRKETLKKMFTENIHIKNKTSSMITCKNYYVLNMDRIYCIHWHRIWSNLECHHNSNICHQYQAQLTLTRTAHCNNWIQSGH